MSFLLAASLVVLLAGSPTKALDIENARAQTQSCFEISKTAAIDLEWITSIKTLYYPLMSRLDLYNAAADLLRKDVKKVSEGSMYYDSCITWSMGTDGGFTISKTAAIDLEWITSIKTLYYPLMSRLDLYNAAADLLQKDVKKVSEGSMYYDSCITWSMGTDGGFTIRGFNGLTADYKTKPLAPNMEKMEIWLAGSSEKIVAYTTMTDNSSYMFFAACTPDNQMVWGVGSTQPTLPKKTVKLIRDHAKSLGFKEEQFTELRYDGCSMQSRRDSTDEL